MAMLYTRQRRAFTLIELLVVVAIIAVLIAMLLPSLSQARDAGRSAKCLANMRDMSVGVRTFAETHGGRFQVVTSSGVSSAEKGFYEYCKIPGGTELWVWP